MEKVKRNGTYSQELTLDQLVYNLAHDKYKSVVMFTGPDIGVPDFKSLDCL